MDRATELETNFSSSNVKSDGWDHGMKIDGTEYAVTPHSTFGRS